MQPAECSKDVESPRIAARLPGQLRTNSSATPRPRQGLWQGLSGVGWVQISQDQQADLPRGTRVTLHLKEDAAEMASPNKLQGLIKQYSQFIQFPIRLWNSRQETDQVPAALPASSRARALPGCSSGRWRLGGCCK